MGATLNTNIIDSYLALLKNLSPGAKLDLISRLTQTLKSDVRSDKVLFESSYGAWQGNKSADEIATEIRNSRMFNREIEEL